MKRLLGKALNLALAPLYILIGLSFTALIYIKSFTDGLSE